MPYGIGDDRAFLTAAYTSPIEPQADLELDDAVAGAPLDISFVHVYGRLPCF